MKSIKHVTQRIIRFPDVDKYILNNGSVLTVTVVILILQSTYIDWCASDHIMFYIEMESEAKNSPNLLY